MARPLISELSRKFGLDINLLAGDINVLQDEQLGWLAVTFSEEDPAKVVEALAYLRSMNVHIKKIEPEAGAEQLAVQVNSIVGGR